ncbi:MAG: hypothetical protein AAGI15_07420 [Pseudomonadota bacterium]
MRSIHSRFRPLVVGLLLLAGAPALGAERAGNSTVLMNTSPAYQCYQAALRRDDSYGVEDCDLAIARQGLSRRDLASTYSNRGLLLGRRGEVKKALKDHSKAIELAPDLASAWINRANALVRQQELASALADLDQAVSLESATRHLAYYNRALLHQRLGNLAAARVDAQRALAEAPEEESYAEFLQTLPARTPLIPERPPEGRPQR